MKTNTNAHLSERYNIKEQKHTELENHKTFRDYLINKERITET